MQCKGVRLPAFNLPCDSPSFKSAGVVLAGRSLRRWNALHPLHAAGALKQSTQCPRCNAFCPFLSHPNRHIAGGRKSTDPTSTL